MRKRPFQGDREAAKAEWLAAYAELGTVSDASHRVGIDRRTAYVWRDADEDFASAWHALSEQVTDGLEKEAVRLAMEGYVEVRTIEQEDGTERTERTLRRDPRILQWLLSTRRRGKYGQRSEVELKGEVVTKRIIWGEDSRKMNTPEAGEE
jgi:single-stranded DNA-binding protein